MKNTEIKERIINDMFQDLNLCIWGDWRDRYVKEKGYGFYNDLELDHELEYDEKEKIWETIHTHPFILDLNMFLNKWEKSFQGNKKTQERMTWKIYLKVLWVDFLKKIRLN